MSVLRKSTNAAAKLMACSYRGYYGGLSIHSQGFEFPTSRHKRFIMSYNIFFISDTHFGHEAPYTKFMLSDGCTFSRPHGSAQAGDEAMVENWNRVVKPADRVYHLGDITMSKRHLPILNRLNGRKVLIRGNHDEEKLSVYAQYFDDVRGVHQFKGLIMSHIPLHPSSLSRWGFNVHGHTHTNRVLDTSGNVDPRYFCVSVEQINYTPISLEEVKKHKPELES